MAISSGNKVEIEPTPPATPLPKLDAEAKPVELTTKTCSSKNCIHKMERTATKEEKDSKDKREDSESDSSDSDSSTSSDDGNDGESDSDSESESKRTKKSKSKSKKNATSSKSKKKSRKHKKSKKSKAKYNTEDDKEDKSEKRGSSIDSSSSDGLSVLKTQLSSQGYDLSKKGSGTLLKLVLRTLSKKGKKAESDDESTKSSDSEEEDSAKSKKDNKEKKDKKKKGKRASKVEFKRLDEIWDEDLYDYKLKETSENKKKDEFEEYIFTVRRKFDNEDHYECTAVDIKSEPLKECLQKVMENVEGISLVEDTPRLDPNMLFLFLEEFRQLKGALTEESKTASKKKLKKAAALKVKHLDILIQYLDKDYDDTKKKLYPLLKSGRISFDLLWALYKPNILAYSATYDDHELPRAFTIESVYKHRSFSRGTYYEIEGKYLDFDGKHFGESDFSAQVNAFQGTRKITSLSCYPLSYHVDVENLKPKLLERGKSFLTLAGMHYKSYKGMAFIKKEDKVLKLNVNGRIMIDPGTFRRINPNYPLGDVEAKLIDVDEDKECSCKESDAKSTVVKKVKTGRYYRLVNRDKDDANILEISAEDQTTFEESIDSAEKEKDLLNTFSEDELMTASPVLPGFSFGEKTWLEFSVSGVGDVTWNEGAFDSLVLPEKHKSIVKALVSAHGLHASKGFDDIIAGKGKGLVAVLHGRPGLGKTLTCEAVSDLLKRPLYTVSAGDLGTNPSSLEAELQAILDIAHTWNAVLLLDEADVFLEERSIQDIHRNALVSIFLRLLEYFQGILFLTTNRVATFDEAFVSRIHLSLRYNDLTTDAKRSVWKTFIDRVSKMDGMAVAKITEKDYSFLARQEVNGRQIKNLVKTAQALALHEEVPMSMEHIRRVMDVAKSFEDDLKGGTGYNDAMRSYT